MSLLDAGARYEDCIVYPEVVVKDVLGNDRTQKSDVGIPARARFQIQGQSGTASRRQEQDNEGFESAKVYRVRFPRKFTTEHGILGAQSVIEWRGQEWPIFGDVALYNSSRRTQHVEYIVKRY